MSFYENKPIAKRQNTQSNSSEYTTSSLDTPIVFKVPQMPSITDEELQSLELPLDLSQCPTDQLVALFTYYTHLVATTGYQLSLIAGNELQLQIEIESETAIQYSQASSTKVGDRKQQASASSSVVSLKQDLIQATKDKIIVNALLDGYKTKYYSIKNELDRRVHIRYEHS